MSPVPDAEDNLTQSVLDDFSKIEFDAVGKVLMGQALGIVMEEIPDAYLCDIVLEDNKTIMVIHVRSSSMAMHADFQWGCLINFNTRWSKQENAMCLRIDSSIPIARGNVRILRRERPMVWEFALMGEDFEPTLRKYLNLRKHDCVAPWMPE